MRCKCKTKEGLRCKNTANPLSKNDFCTIHKNTKNVKKSPRKYRMDVNDMPSMPSSPPRLRRTFTVYGNDAGMIVDFVYYQGDVMPSAQEITNGFPGLRNQQRAIDHLDQHELNRWNRIVRKYNQLVTGGHVDLTYYHGSNQKMTRR